MLSALSGLSTGLEEIEMKIRNRDGKSYSLREFFSKWKEGIQGITPLQQKEGERTSYLIILFGVFAGLIAAIMTKTAWLVIIMIGSLGLLIFQFIACLQMLWALQKQEEIMKSIPIRNQQEGIQEYVG